MILKVFILEEMTAYIRRKLGCYGNVKLVGLVMIVI